MSKIVIETDIEVEASKVEKVFKEYVQLVGFRHMMGNASSDDPYLLVALLLHRSKSVTVDGVPITFKSNVKAK